MDEELNRYLIHISYKLPTIDVQAETEEDAIDKAYQQLQSQSQLLDEIERTYDIEDESIEYFNGYVFYDESINIEITLEERNA